MTDWTPISPGDPSWVPAVVETANTSAAESAAAAAASEAVATAKATSAASDALTATAQAAAAAATLAGAVKRDGTNSPTANLPMDGFRHTGVGAATTRTQYVDVAGLQDGAYNWVDGGGTADAITATYAPALTTLVDGQLCFVRATAANATTTPTFSPNGVAAHTITKSGGGALVAGDIAGDGHELILRYNLAGTRWELLNPARPKSATDLGVIHTTGQGLVTGAGHGATNDAVLAALVATGQNIYIDPPAGIAEPDPTTDYYELTDTLVLDNARQCITGEFGKVFFKQATTNKNCFSVTAANVEISGIWFYATGEITSLLSDSGILLNGCNRAVVRNCLFSGMRASGVTMYNATNCLIADNYFIDSPVSESDESANCNADIYVGYSSQYNTVRNNYLLSGNGMGISVQTITSGDTANDNRIIGNFIYGYRMYGINAYRENSADSLSRTLIANNTIDGVTGGIINSSTSTYTFGTGIYVQGAENVTVEGNQVYNTHSASKSFAETLAPGSIGFANVGSFTCTGNMCKTDKIAGIYVNDANGDGDANGVGLIANNQLLSTVNGIKVKTRPNIKIVDNVVTGATDAAISVVNASSKANYEICGNKINNNSGAGFGIQVDTASNVMVDGNSCDGATNYFCFMNTVTGAWSVTNNRATGLVLRGIQYTSCTGQAIVSGNILAGSGGSTNYGIGAESPCLCKDNLITGFAAQFEASSSAGYPVGVDTTDTGSVTLTPFTSPPVTRFTASALSGDTTVTLSTTGAVEGVTKWRVTSPADLATHAFTVGGKSMSASSWVEFEFDGSNYVQTGYGSL